MPCWMTSNGACGWGFARLPFFDIEETERSLLLPPRPWTKSTQEEANNAVSTERSARITESLAELWFVQLGDVSRHAGYDRSVCRVSRNPGLFRCCINGGTIVGTQRLHHRVWRAARSGRAAGGSL